MWSLLLFHTGFAQPRILSSPEYSHFSALTIMLVDLNRFSTSPEQMEMFPGPLTLGIMFFGGDWAKEVLTTGNRGGRGACSPALPTGFPREAENPEM